MSTDFSAALNTNMDDVVKPKPLPAGLYNVTVLDKKLIEARSGTQGLEVSVRVDAPGADVEMALLEGVKWEGREMRSKFWLTPEAMFRMKDFLTACGINSSGRVLSQCLEEIGGQSVVGVLTQEITDKLDSDGDQVVYCNFDKFMPAE